MSLEDTLYDTMYGAPRRNARTRAERIDVEVIFVSHKNSDYTVRLTEDGKTYTFPASGVKVVSRQGRYWTMRLSERKAIDYNLI